MDASPSDLQVIDACTFKNVVKSALKKAAADRAALQGFSQFDFLDKNVEQ